MIALKGSGEVVKLKFGEWLRIARSRAGLTQAEIAGRLGVKPQTISNWENGISTPSLDPSQTRCFCVLLDVGLDELANAYEKGDRHE